MEYNLRLCFPAIVLLLSIARGGDDSKTVTGRIGGSIDLSIQRTFNARIKEVDWKFVEKSGKFRIAEIKEKQLIPHHFQFENRLEMFGDETQLRIKNLIFNDIGTYIARITLENDDVHEEPFRVNLFEPVPSPVIRYSYGSGTSNRCYVTLLCDVPANTTPLSYTWKTRQNTSDYQQYESTSDTIQMSFQPEFGDMEVMCIVQNPADCENVSVTLEPCDQKVPRFRWPIVGSVAFVFLLSVAGFVFLKKEDLKISIPETDQTLSLSEKRSKEEVYVSPEEVICLGPKEEKCIDPEEEECLGPKVAVCLHPEGEKCLCPEEEGCLDPKGEVSFLFREKAVKYQHTVSIHRVKQ